jgi:biotin synthase
MTKNEIIKHLSESSTTIDFRSHPLFLSADRMRASTVGDGVHLRGLIEFSNYCKNNCLYCGIRRDNTSVNRYRMTPAEIVNITHRAYKLGLKTIVLQGGEDPYFTIDILSEIVKQIKKTYDIAITLSIGELETSDIERLREAGADRFLLRIETTDRKLYERLHPDMSYENRVRCLRDLKKYRFEVGTGCLVGLPEQTIESLADDILFFSEINADMIGIGPFIPNPSTPLSDANSGNFLLTISVMALTRLTLPHINIPATTAMETIHPDGRFIALQCGANVIMPNINETKFASSYQLYPGKFVPPVDIEKHLSDIKTKLESIGRHIL